jgi:hypothetical protein
VLALTYRRFGLVLGLGVPALLLAFAGPVRAAVVEPNGVKVPGPSSDPSEEPLQTFFNMQMENIDVVADASTDPGVFQPLCNFKATLVLKQSMAIAGIAWYNVPTDATSKPTEIFPIVQATATMGATLGQLITSADIATNPKYTGGFIGFALTRNLNGLDNQPVYYSEFRRNADCTSCTMPGNWKMFLAYPSTATPGAFYIAFEDWPGADSGSWQGNDGDFNDQVYKIEGVTCLGGGVPCDTGGLGACKPGLTECGLGGAIVCHPQVTATAETCDNYDNDCNGMVDDGNLCPTDQVCSNGSCVGDCRKGEFPCQGALVCDSTGHCVDPLCANIMCDAGKACRSGTCVDACSGVTCPLGQTCDLGSGRCSAPCDGVSCPMDQVCENGVCVANCSCRACSTGEACNKTSGVCVPSGCETVTCTAPQICQAGACADPCTATTVCPGGAACADGHCGDPIPGASGGAGGSTGAGGGTIGSGGIVFGTGGGIGSLSGAGGAVTGSGASGGKAPSSKATNKASGCACRAVGGRARGDWLALSFGLLGLIASRRRGARVKRSGVPNP